MARRLRTWLAWSSCLVALCVCFLTASAASAAVRVELPPGWSEGTETDAEARDRAAKWAVASGMQIVQLGTSAGEDEFVESVVVLERNVPLEQKASVDADVALEQLRSDLSGIFGAAGPAPESSGFREVSDGEVFHGRWVVDGITYDCMLVPSGASYSVVMTSFLSEDAVLYRSLIEELLDSVSGTLAPITPFDRGPWRWGPWISWFLLAGALHMLMLRFTDRAGDHRTATRRAAIVLVCLAALAALLSYLTLMDRADSIVASGASVGGIAGEVFMGGAIFSALLMGAGSMLDRGERVRSAPEQSTHETFRRMEPAAGLEPVVHGQAPKEGEPKDAVPGHVTADDDERGRTPGGA